MLNNVSYMLVLGMIASCNKITNLGFRSKNHTLFETKGARIDTLFLTKTAQNTHTLCGRTYLYSPHKGVPPPPQVHSITLSISMSSSQATLSHN